MMERIGPDTTRVIFELWAWLLVILLLSCLPGLGLVLSTAAGAIGVKTHEFVLWSMIAKMARKWLLLIIVVNLYRLVVDRVGILIYLLLPGTRRAFGIQ